MERNWLEGAGLSISSVLLAFVVLIGVGVASPYLTFLSPVGH